MSIDIDRLEALAKAAQAASPSPWQFLDRDDNQFVVTLKSRPVCALGGVHARTAEFQHIAAADPTTILALCARIRLLTRVAEAAKATCALCSTNAAEWHPPKPEAVGAFTGWVHYSVTYFGVRQSCQMSRELRDALAALNPEAPQ